LSESGSSHDEYDYTTYYDIDEDGNWWATDGDGSANGNGEDHSSSSGSGTATIAGGLSGSFHVDDSDDDSYGYDTTATFASGRWTESGDGWDVTDHSNGSSFSGSGSYMNSSGTPAWEPRRSTPGSAFAA
jgi:hypothetical protein